MNEFLLGLLFGAFLCWICMQPWESEFPDPDEEPEFKYEKVTSRCSTGWTRTDNPAHAHQCMIPWPIHNGDHICECGDRMHSIYKGPGDGS